MTLLITGGTGRLGSELVKLFPDCLSPTHDELDITIEKEIRKYVCSHRVNEVIHCAAITDIRFCEEHRNLAYEMNVNGTRNLINAIKSSSFPSVRPYMIYVSTACVFSGDSGEQLYSEEDLPYPKNFYGLTKLLGEYMVLGKSNLVARTNFVRRGPWAYPKAFADRFGTYLYADQVASVIQQLFTKRIVGLVHIAGNKRMSMYELARQYDEKVQPIRLDTYTGPPVTANMCLTSKRIPLVPFVGRI